MTARYIGMNADTGNQLTELDHIRQSIGKILTTPLGSRVMRRDFGSMIPDLIDKPLNGKTRMQVIAATAMAISNWEPRVELSAVQLISPTDSPASLIVDLDTIRRDGINAGQRATLSIPIR